MRDRFVFLHYHIFKNAGSTIDWILRNNFPDAFVSIHEIGERGSLHAEDIIEYILEHPQVVALSSHHFRFPRPERTSLHIIDTCFIRHPLDRIQSMYYHFNRNDDLNDEKSIKAKQMPMPEFLWWMLENEPFNLINAQTVCIANSGAYFFPPSIHNLAIATRRMREVRFLGVVEHFDTSCVIAEYFLKAAFPHLDLSYLSQNVSQGRSRTLSERLDDMRSLCGDYIYDELKRRNSLDEELWKQAIKELNRRLQFVPNVQSRLHALLKASSAISINAATSIPFNGG